MTKTEEDLGEGLEYDGSELRKFEGLANEWWDSSGSFRALHAINPLRVRYIEERYGTLLDCQAVDVGCGGGLLSEALAVKGCRVTGIDVGSQVIAVAGQHAQESALDIRYVQTTAATFLEQEKSRFSLVCCLELLEHVPDPKSLVDILAALCEPGGHVFISTINRNLSAFCGAIVAAEYLLHLLPVGTHSYHKFIKPSELRSAARDAGLVLADLRGIFFNPLTQKARLTDNPKVNYIAHFIKLTKASA